MSPPFGIDREDGGLMRVVFVSTGLGVGGAEISLLNILQCLDRARFAPHVVSLNGKGEIGGRIEALGVPVTYLEMSNKPISSFIALVRLIRRVQPRIVQTWMYHADLIGGIAARIAGARQVIWGIRNSSLAPGLGGGVVTVAKLCARLSRWVPQAVVSCSHEALAIHRNLGYRCARQLVIGNGFDLEQFRPDPASRASVRTELAIPAAAKIVTHVGRYHAQKNHFGLIHAASALHRHCPDVHVVMVGKGVSNDNPEIHAAVAAAGIGNVVHLLGLRHDIPRLVAASDLLVSSSTFGEAFPRVLGEALACGVPCVTTNVGDSSSIVGDCGRVVPPGDDAALAVAMQDLLSLPAEQHEEIALRARRRAVDNLDIRGVVRQYEALYFQIGADSTCVA
ncbi:MAG: glycosyltransferase [Burkholderiaceae bacterium]